MGIQEGFNRIGISVALAFLGLSLICLMLAASNYLEYRSEIAVEYEKRYGKPLQDELSDPVLDGGEKRMRDWNRFKELRFRSVGQALNLAIMCVVSAFIALIFWFLVGQIYTLLSYWVRLRKTKSKT